MLSEISRALCQSDAIIGLSPQFSVQRKETFALQESQGALKQVVLVLRLSPETHQTPAISCYPEDQEPM